MYKFFTGIDVSKNISSVCGLDRNGKRCFSISFAMDSHGFSELLKNIQSHCADLSKVIVAMESTGCYHLNLFSFLISKGIKVVVVNPLLIANFAKLSLRKTKTDKKDALTIAQFLLIHKDSLTQMDQSHDMQDLRDLARQRESLVDQMTSLKSDIKRLLTITFPELEHITGVFTKSMLRLLRQFPSAQAIRNTKRSRIAKLLIPGSYGKQTEESVEAIRKAAQTSIGTASPTKELILSQKVALLIQLEEHLQELTGILIELCKSKIQKNLNILTSMKGIGNKTATNFLIEIGGDISLFETHRKLIAMAGLDPAVYQSGKSDRKGKISKRGNRHLRRVIWLMTTKVIQFNGRFKHYHLKRMKEGLPYKMAVMATAHKLIRVLYAMLRDKTVFNARMN